MSRSAHLLVIACGCLLGACGDGAGEPARTTAATPAATATAEPTATASPAATTTATPTPTIPPATEEGGDEGGNRVELHFDLLAEEITPPQVEVPAFLGLRIRVRNLSGAERIVRVDGRPVLELLPGQAETADVDGLRPGDHRLEAGESGRATLTAVRAG